ncbi:MAG: nucleotidyltransferase domain-containing protein [Candidatus Micrarchaeota archaeon]
MLFDEGVKWRLLRYFFKNAGGEHYVKQLAKTAGVSAGSASSACKSLEGEGFLASRKHGNALFYSLNNDNPAVLRLKSAWFLAEMGPLERRWKDAEFQSVALYGSYASGEFVEKSDIDLLFITNVKKSKALDVAMQVQQHFKARVSPTVLKAGEWMEMARGKERFYMEVVANHVLLHGTSVVVG